MKNVIFVAPYLMDATNRFLAAATQSAETRVALVSCDSLNRLDPSIRKNLTCYETIQGIETRQIFDGVQRASHALGSVDRLLGMLEQIQVGLGEIRDHLGIDGMGAIAAHRFRDKSEMKNCLQQAGIPCARHRLITDWQSAEDFARLVGFPLIVKPPDGAGAKGTFRCESLSQLQACLGQFHYHDQQAILLEEFMTGREFSFDSVMLQGNLVWSSICKYAPGPLEVVREPWIQWCVVIPRSTAGPPYDAIQAVAQPALKALGMVTGLSHMEWFCREDQSVAVSEVGARPPGAQIVSLMSYAHDYNLYQGWADLMIHDQFTPPQRKYACGAAYLRGMGRGRVVAVQGLESIAAQFNDLVVEARIPDSGQPASDSYEGEGYIIVRHPQTETVELALQAIVENVRVKLEDR